MRRALIVTTALALALTGAAAHANIWQHATAPTSPAKDDVYDHAMRAGDDAAELARSRASSSIAMVRRLVQQAVDAYKIAAQARPSDGEPWYRIGMVLYQFYFECNNDPRLPPRSLLCDLSWDRKRAEETIAAWDEFEKRAPLDPRVSFVDSEDAELLFQRAILHTKLIDSANAKANKAHLEAAARDYEKIIQRIDSSNTGTLFYEEVVGNLAETYMMLDRLEEAVDTYREALRHGARTSTAYGLAVALDRDERGGEALDIIHELGEQQVQSFHDEVLNGSAFFVPEGEKFYYYALLDEAYDHLVEAARDWQLYISSGAHPEFQPRAKQHLAALRAKHIRREVPHLDWLDE